MKYRGLFTVLSGIFLALALAVNVAAFELLGSPRYNRELSDGPVSFWLSGSWNPFSANHFTMSLQRFDNLFDHTSALGPYYEQTSNFSGLLPISLNDHWNLVAHALVPAISNGMISDQPKELNDAYGFGDATAMFLISPVKSDGNFLWGVGPVVALPTATADDYGLGKWLAGPAVAGFYSGDSWLFGMLSQHRWSLDDFTDGTPVSQTMLQYFFQYSVSDRLQVGMIQSLFLNWNGQSQNSYFPFNLEMARTVQIGKFPVKFSLDGFFEVTANWKF